MPRSRRIPTARSLVLAAERRFRRAGLHFGHGTDNARDEAVLLVFHALDLPFDCSDDVLAQPLDAAACAAVEALVAARIARRCPAAYLTGKMWFAGHAFHVDENVLVPRSPIAELIRRRFTPWLGGAPVRRILDIGTGSGCIAIAAAHAFPGAEVDATDISPAALRVAARNVEAHALHGRVHLHEADLFPPAGGGSYDLILANPPYVPEAEMTDLPDEYTHEPRIALVADEGGLALIRRILCAAPAYMRAHALLVLDAGGTWPAVDAAFPALPFTWVDLVDGGDGIAVISAADLAEIPLQ